jgi:hypothetical protein
MKKKLSLQRCLPLTSVSCDNLSQMKKIFLQAGNPVLELNGKERDWSNNNNNNIL